MTKILLRMLVLGCLGLSFSGCSTVEGLGKDLKKSGQALEKAAKKAANG